MDIRRNAANDEVDKIPGVFSVRYVHSLRKYLS